MDGTVRDLLAARDIILTPIELTDIHGFKCIGVAERVPEISHSISSQVHVWHVTEDLYPVTESEVERWLVDAPSGKHWILSEREFDPSLFDDSESVSYTHLTLPTILLV